MKKILVAVAVLLTAASFGGAQEIVTAANFFNQVSDRYGAVADYEAKIAITMEKSAMTGVLRYKSPHRVRIDFTDPQDQVINTDGKTLTVYLPRYSVSFTQELRKHSGVSVAAMASKQGLNLLKNNYSIAYSVGPAPVPLDDAQGKDEQVTKLKLTWRSSGEAFRQLEISVGANGFIRRISGITVNYATVQFDFTGIRTNIGVPDNRFEYDDPPTSNRISNFLFDPEG